MEKLHFLLLQVLTYLAWKVFSVEVFFKNRHRTRLVFTEVRFGDLVVKGVDIKMAKGTYGQVLSLIVATIGGFGIQPGSAQFSLAATDSEGNDVSSDFTELPANPNNELERKWKHTGTTECTGVVTVRADGDRDTDEEAPLVGTFDFIIDEPNVTGLSLSGTFEDAPPEEGSSEEG